MPFVSIDVFLLTVVWRMARPSYRLMCSVDSGVAYDPPFVSIDVFLLTVVFRMTRKIMKRRLAVYTSTSLVRSTANTADMNLSLIMNTTLKGQCTLYETVSYQ